ncbi:MAG: DNA polymerase Y family protein [Rhodospirillales bacterium]
MGGVGRPKTGLRWLYLDLNSYFASVEQQLDPSIRGRPVAVVPVMSESTCAIAASYEAKAFGIKTGTKIYEAKRRCPDLILRPARHDLYVKFHRKTCEEIDRHIPIAKVCSIDEVACSLIGSERVRANAVDLAQRIKQGIRERVGDYIGCSIGIAPTRFLAKVASDMEKPDGLVCWTRMNCRGGC